MKQHSILWELDILKYLLYICIMRKIKVYLAERDGEVLPFLYMRNIMEYYNIPGVYNIRMGDDIEYGGVRIRRFYLDTKYGK